MDTILDRLSTSVTSARTVEELARPLLELLAAVTGLESTYLTVVDLEHGIQKILFARNTRRLDIAEGLSVPWADTLCKRALESNQPLTSDVSACWGDSDAARKLGIKTYLSSPVYLADGGLYGTLCAASTDQHAIQLSSQRVMGLFSTLIAYQIEREQLVNQLVLANKRLVGYAMTDSLTALANRRALKKELSRMLSKGSRQNFWILVAFVDLDDFKAINDVHGHHVGDQFLVEMAARIRTSLREGDFAARVGGDEFVVIGPGPGDSRMLDRARRSFEKRVFEATVGEFRLEKTSFTYAGASVGVLQVEPGTRDSATVLKDADALMYEIKASRRGAAAKRMLQRAH